MAWSPTLSNISAPPGWPTDSEPNWTGAEGGVQNQSAFANEIAVGAINRAVAATSAMEEVTLDTIPLPAFSLGQFNPSVYSEPDKPTSDISALNLPQAPTRPNLDNVNLDSLSVEAPVFNIDDPNISIPASPSLVEPESPGSAPSLKDIELPEYEGGELPTVPSLEELRIPVAPDISFDEFDVSRPEFSAPDDYLYDNNLIAETKELASQQLEKYKDNDLDGKKLRDVWSEMAEGGTGLPPEIEQALFDRAVNRDEVSSVQAIRQAQGEWAARGFSMPGSTILARESEIRTENRKERGRINRELSIQQHTQQIENLRFVVEQGVRLESQRQELFIRTLDAARSVVTSSYEVYRSLLSARVDILNSQLQIYQTDVQVFREKLQIELNRLEVFRAQIEAEQAKGTINQQKVDVYRAQLSAVQTNADVYRAQIEGANGLIRAETEKMNAYRARVQAFQAQWEGEQTKVEVYNSKVAAEETKARVYEGQIRGYAERVNAYRASTEAARSGVEAQTNLNESKVRQYSAEVEAWSQNVSANIERIRAEISEFQARVQLYSADISGEEARIRAEDTNSRRAFELVRAEVDTKVKQVDQQIEQLRLAETLGLEALRNSAQVNSQLASSALSAINVSASISDSVSSAYSKTDSESYSETYTGEI